MISVRKLSVSELGLLTKLFKYNDEKSAIAENELMINSGTADIFCIFDNEVPFGELRVKYKSDDILQTVDTIRVYFYAFRINMEYRGKGYGKMLMESVIRTLQELGYREFTIGVGDENHRAKHIYEYFGFTEILAKRYEEYQGDKYFYTLYLKS